MNQFLSKNAIHSAFDNWHKGLQVFVLMLCTAFMLFAPKAQAQVVTLGSGTNASSVISGLSPVSLGARFGRVQVVYTAAEINAAGITGIRPISNIAFNVASAVSSPHSNYSVRLGHTTATDASAHITTNLKQVFNANSITFGSTGWFPLQFDSVFLWNGTDNIVVDICWGANASASNAGSVLVYDPAVTAGSRSFGTINSANICGATTNLTINNKPQVQLTFPALYFDVGVDAIEKPVLGCIGGTEDVELIIKNYGPTDAYFQARACTVMVVLSGTNTDTLTQVINTGFLSVSDTLRVKMGTFNMANAGQYDITAYTSTPADTILPNNQEFRTFDAIGAPTPLPVFCDFNSYSGSNTGICPGFYETDGKQVPNAPGYSAWFYDEFMNDASHPFGRAARISLSFTSDEEWIVGPLVSVNNLTRFSFDWCAMDAATSSFGKIVDDDFVEVRISTDCGNSFTPIWRFDSSSTLQTSYTSEMIDLSAYMGQSVILGVYADEGSVSSPENIYFMFDNFKIFDLSPTDAALETILSPVAGGCYTNSEPVTVTIKNTGTATIDFATNNATITANITGAVTQTLTQTLTSGSLAVGATMDVSLGNLNMTTGGTYNLSANIALTGDGDNTNDALSGSYAVDPLVSLPLSVDFESFTGSNLSTVHPGWIEADGYPLPDADGISSWFDDDFLNNTSHPWGNSADLSGSSNSDNEWIISPKFFVGPNTVLSFVWGITEDGSQNDQLARIIGDDEFEVLITTDCGASWQSIFKLDSTSNVDMNGTLEYMNLSAYAGNAVQVGFLLNEKDESFSPTYQFFLDEINIYNATSSTDVLAAGLDFMYPACPSATMDLPVRVANPTNAPIDFATSNLTLTVSWTGAATGSATATISSGTLPAGTVGVFSAGTADLTTPGDYDFTITASIAGDANPTNNTFPAPYTYTIKATHPLPLSMDFTDYNGTTFGTGNEDWYEAEGPYWPMEDASSWFRDDFANNTSHPFGDAASFNYDFKDENEWIVTPKVKLGASTIFSYDIIVTDDLSSTPDSIQGDDKFSVMISTDCGNTFKPIKVYTNQTPIASTGQRDTIDLAAYANQEAVFAFYVQEGDDPNGRDVNLFIDNVFIINVVPVEVAPTEYVGPVSNIGCPGANMPLVAKVKQFGNSPINLATNPLTVQAWVYGPTDTVMLDTIINTGVLLADSSMDVTVGYADFTTPGDYTVSFVTIIAGDASATNDTLVNVNVFTSEATYALPVVNDFENYSGSNLEANYPGWFEANGTETAPDMTTLGVSTSWFEDDFGNNTSHPFGQSIRFYLYSSTWSDPQHSWFITPKFMVTPTTNLFFDMALTDAFNSNPDVIQGDDHVDVAITTDCGNTWTVLVSYDSSSSIPNTGMNVNIDLSPYAGQTARIGFLASEGTNADTDGKDVFFDNINIREVFDTDLAAVSVWPLTEAMCLGTESVAMVVQNAGTLPINFGSNMLTALVRFNGTITSTVANVVTSGTLNPGDTMTVQLGLVDLSSNFGDVAITGIVSLNGDMSATNDTASSGTIYHEPAYDLPISQPFTSYNGSNLDLIGGWFETDDFLMEGPNVAVDNYALWDDDDFANDGSSPYGRSARFNLYLTGSEGWLVGPKITPTAYTTMEFMVAQTDFGNTQFAPLANGDTIGLFITTDCGANWLPVMIWDTLNQVDSAGEKKIVDLSTYAGQQIRFGFYVHEKQSGSTYSRDVDFFVDEINIFNQFPEDLGVVEIWPQETACGVDSIEVKAAVENFGITASPLANVKVMVSGDVTQTLTYSHPGGIAPGAIDTITFSPKISVTGADSVYLTVFTELATDALAANDTSSGAVPILSVPANPTAMGDTAFCEGGYATLMGTTANNDTSLSWSSNRGNFIAEGNTVTFGPVDSTTTFYVVNSGSGSGGAGGSFGPGDNTMGGTSGGFMALNYSTSFTMFKTARLAKIFTYAENAGVVAWEILQGGSLLHSGTSNVTGAANGEYMDIDVMLVAGNYDIRINWGNTTTDLWRNSSGASYPYTTTGLGEVTGNGFSTTYYYYFYEFVFGGGGCQSDLDSVTVTVSPLPTKPTITQMHSDSLVANSSGSKYVWFKNGVELTGTDSSSVLEVPSENAFYSVVPLSSIGCVGPESDPFQYFAPLAVSEVVYGNPEATLFPNPNTGSFTLEMANYNTKGNVNIQLFDAVGKLIDTRAYQNGSLGNMHTETYNLSQANKGMYLIRVVADNDVLIKRVIVQ